MSDSLQAPYSLPGFSLHEVFQARILEWVVMSSSRRSSRPRDETLCLLHLLHWSEVAQSCLTFCDPMDSSLPQSPLSMGFSRQEYWSGLSFPSPGNLPTQVSHIVDRRFTIWATREVLASAFLTISATWEAPVSMKTSQIQLKYVWVHLYYSCWLSVFGLPTS